MLWLPSKEMLRAKRRLRRRRRRQRIARVLLFVFFLFGLVAASPPPRSALQVEVDRLTAAHRFDFVDWESQAVASELWRRLVAPDLPADYAGQRALVDRYMAQEKRLRHLRQGINQVYAGSADPTREAAALEQELAETQAAQAEIRSQFELILSRQVEAVLADEGFIRLGRVFPPVAFRLMNPPTVLVLSARDRIEKQHFTGLAPGLDISRRVEIEQALDVRGDVSSYVTNIGGLASYPTMVVNDTFLPYLIEVIAHEWTHNYLYTFPTNIAWGYQTYPRMTTINETTADIVGKEVGRKVIARFYPDLIPKLPPLTDDGLPAPREPSEFDLAMRRIRLRVDELLAAGKIEEAEMFMEQERQQLVEQGYNLRRLNQAYFAFHGSYATNPASVDPTGAQLRQLRASSSSLKVFLDNIGWLNSDDDYRALLARSGLNT